MKNNDRECRQCHLKFSEFEATGLLGCPTCYDEFQDAIDRILIQRHGTAVYSGKRCAMKIEDSPENVVDVKKLREELSDAVKREEFELAARIRDAINNSSNAGSGPR
jgi:protein arginine kinase activator